MQRHASFQKRCARSSAATTKTCGSPTKVGASEFLRLSILLCCTEAECLDVSRRLHRSFLCATCQCQFMLQIKVPRFKRRGA